MIRVILCGAAGRMGREIIAAADAMNDIKIVAGIEAPGHPAVGQKIAGIPVLSDLTAVLKDGDCVVDFSNHRAALDNLGKAETSGRPYIIGSTGFSPEEAPTIRQAAERLPVFLSPNLALGVNQMYELVRLTTRKLADFEIEIVETHHRGKKDAPSGTAREIGRIVKDVRPETRIIYGREGNIGERNKDEVCINTVRGGDVVGEHRVLFLGDGEFLELRHYATSRRCFVQGTFAAIRFMHDKKPGLYGMADLLGIDNK
jgi:4-hydroxy-tetrahydrodipicolinate reductase